MRGALTMLGLAICFAPAAAATPVVPTNSAYQVAQAMVPPTGMEEKKKPMTLAERMQARFPQPVLVGDLIGLPVLDDSSCMLGHVREVVRTADDKIELIVSRR